MRGPSIQRFERKIITLLLLCLFAGCNKSLIPREPGIIRVQRKGSAVVAIPSRIYGGMITTNGMTRDCKIIAHRGYWKAHGSYENSLSAIVSAAELGVDGIEFDLWKTKDDTIIVNHNSTYAGNYIAGSLYSDLIQTPLPNGEKLPTLREYLRIIKEYPHLYLFIELKSAQAALPTVQMLEEEHIENPRVFISFSQAACKLVMDKLPEAHVELLQSSGNLVSVDTLFSAGYSGLAYSISLYRSNLSVVEHAHRLGMTLSTWTLNSVKDYDEFFKYGFSYVITDRPDILVDQTLHNKEYWSLINIQLSFFNLNSLLINER